MGGSGGGGGSAGEVSWPDYLESEHQQLIDSAWIAASISNPYFGEVDVYDGTSLIEEFSGAVTNFGNSIAVTNPWDEWNNIFNTSVNRYEFVIGSSPEFFASVPDSWLIMQDIWTFAETVLNAADDIDTFWVAPTISGDTNITGAWETPSPNAPDDIDTNLAASATISAAVSAYGARLSDAITSDTLPRFQAGMRDINAVQSSSFAIGAAIIEAMRVRDVANFDADLTTKLTAQRDNLIGQAYMQDDKILAADLSDKNKMLSQVYLESDKILAGSVIEKNKTMSGAYLQDDKIRGAEVAEANKVRSQALIQYDKINADSAKAHSLIAAEMARHGTAMVYQDADLFWKTLHQQQALYGQWASMVVDSDRIAYVMHKEYFDKNSEYGINGNNWSMEMANKLANVLASVSGGTSYTPGPTPAQNALGGAFSGAAIGARATGNAYGAGAGAILGGIGAYLMGGSS